MGVSGQSCLFVQTDGGLIANALQNERFLAPMFILYSEFMIQLIIVLNRKSSLQITMSQL